MNEEEIADEDSKDEMKAFEQVNNRREIDHFIIQNEHMNQINDGLMKANRMLKQDLHEVKKNYSELIEVAEEVVKRRKVMQEQNVQLVKDKEELEIKLKDMQKELKRLQIKAHALDGLATLVEVAIRL